MAGSDCLGPCVTCRTHYIGGCMAGHGDDGYAFASPEWIDEYTRGKLISGAAGLEYGPWKNAAELDANIVERAAERESLSATGLWKHQVQAVDFARNKQGTLLAMGMGSGKTACAVRLIEEWDCRRVLVLCPKSVVRVWPGQVSLHGKQAWTVLPLDTGTLPRRQKELAQALTLQATLGTRLLVVLNYDVLPYSIGQYLKTVQWDALVEDECHRLKGPAGRQSRLCSQLADRVPRRLGLTGTPMPHSPLDIYGQFRALDKRVFGTSYALFRARYAVMGGFQNHTVVAFRDLDDLHERMYARTFRCRTCDVVDLPEYTDVDRYCELEPEARRVYDTLAEEMVVELESGLLSADNALVKLLRLAQVANGTVKDDAGEMRSVGTEKQQLLAEVLEELKAGWQEAQEPVVVFYRFSVDGNAIHETAQGLGLTTAELSGRRNDLATWQDGQADILVVQLQAGGVGIDLTRARYVIYHSSDWSLGNHEQSRARVHRPGQTRPVTYIHLLARSTVDEQVRKALEKKAAVVDFVLDAMREGR